MNILIDLIFILCSFILLNYSKKNKYMFIFSSILFLGIIVLFYIYENRLVIGLIVLFSSMIIPKHKNYLEKILETELLYIKQFTKFIESDKFISFTDEFLPDMYMHNFTLIKNQFDLNEVINEKLVNNLEFLRFELNEKLDENINLPLNPTITEYDIMIINTNDYPQLNGNEECKVVEVNSDELYNLGKQFDLLASANLGEFASRRIERKIAVYKENNIKYFICIYNDQVVGSCELFINGETAKIEDFSVLEFFQRNGIGTAILKHVIKEAYYKEVKTAYVVTESSDSAKDMYKKCKFIKVLSKTEIFYKF